MKTKQGNQCAQCSGSGEVVIGGMKLVCGPCQGLGERLDHVKDLRRTARRLRNAGLTEEASITDQLADYIVSLESVLRHLMRAVDATLMTHPPSGAVTVLDIRMDEARKLLK